MKPATLHEGAEAELRDALNYYAGQRPGLDGEFRREFEAALVKVRENPRLYAVEDVEGVRYCPLRRCPYTLVDVDLEDRIWVAALATNGAGLGTGRAVAQSEPDQTPNQALPVEGRLAYLHCSAFHR